MIARTGILVRLSTLTVLALGLSAMSAHIARADSPATDIAPAGTPVPAESAATLTDELPAQIGVETADKVGMAEALESVNLSTQRGCGEEAVYEVGEVVRVTFTVSRSDYYQLSIQTEQGTYYPAGTAYRLLSVGPAYYLDMQVSAGPAERTVKVAGHYTGETATCVYGVGTPPDPTETPTETPEPTETPTETPDPTETPTETPEPTETPTETPEPTETPNPEHKLIRMRPMSGPGLCLGRTTYGTLTGSARLTLSACDDGNEAQDWLVEVVSADDDQIRVTSAVDGKCLTLSAAGARLKACDGQASQTITVEGESEDEYLVKASDGAVLQARVDGLTGGGSLWMCADAGQCGTAHAWKVEIY